MDIALRVLVVDDSEDDAALLIHELRRGGYDPTFQRVETAEAMRAALDRDQWEVVIADYAMPRFDGPAALKVLQEAGQDIPFIIVSGSIGEEIAVSAMKAGAHDYVMKDNLKRLVTAIERELREAKSRQERRQADEMVRYQAYYDVLTTLPNRTQMRDLLQQAIRAGERDTTAATLLLMDLDHFKEINDTLGHPCGDSLLQQIAIRLQSAVWESDTVFRLGGDEFAVLLPRLGTADHVRVVIQKILKALEPPFMIEDLPIAVEASIGVALYPDHGANADTLIQKADVAMYVAKEAGSVYTIYAPELDRHNPRRLALMGELRRAIQQDQLFLHYQPQISLATGRIIGAEALVRWQHPEYGFIPPGQFIEPAERTGLIKPLTLWVLKAVCRQSGLWRRAGIEMPISANLSARNLQDPQLPDHVAEMLQVGHIPPGGLELEITESAIMADPARALEAVKRLKAMNCRFLIDDFGTGYSSLSNLKKLPVDKIKVDRSFVTEMAANRDDEVIVRSTIELGHNLGLKVVAEGVESQEILDRLIALGCDEAQGYYLCRPLPADDLGRWLKESPWGLKEASHNA
ncbi:MAG: EAL domain-containing protein [Nitrospirae bacterium]|nr:EAL domain-containing protein [Nitrospirota bacterium]